MTECCEAMQAQVDWVCPDHPHPSDCADSVIVKVVDSAILPDPTYGLRIHDGGTSFLHIEFCPWCGRNLLPVMVKLDADLVALRHIQRLLKKD